MHQPRIRHARLWGALATALALLAGAAAKALQLYLDYETALYAAL
jgi:hypothetical protein